jgi:hypothetical protein
MGDHRRCRRRPAQHPPSRRCAEQAAVVGAYLEALDAGNDPRRLEILTPAGRCTLEEAFVAVGAEYAARRRISTEAWQAVGVPAAVLAAARISRSSGPTPPGRRSG